MATESGTVLSVSSPTQGSITRDSGASPNPCSYDEPDLPGRGITLLPGDRVTYDIDLDAIITNITPIVAPTTESGIINEVGSQDAGTIIRSNGFDPNPIGYNDPTLTTRGIMLSVGDCVTYTLTGSVVSNVTPCPAPEKLCKIIPFNCDYCFTLELDYVPILNVMAGLTPSTVYYLWITDKFGNQYIEQFATNSDGSFDIDTTLYPDALFNPLAGWFDIFISTDVDGTDVVPMTFVDEFSCLKLSTTC